jgi:hypothetical protein
MVIWKIRYFLGDDLAESVVCADTIEEAINILINEYKVKKEDIEEYEEIIENGIILTWWQPKIN